MGHLQDGPGFAVYFGAFWAKGDTIYWWNGSTSPNDAEHTRIRGENGPNYAATHPQAEDYSVWSEEKRALVYADIESQRIEYRLERERHEQRRKVLCWSAKAKLTSEEWEAVVEAAEEGDL